MAYLDEMLATALKRPGTLAEGVQAATEALLSGSPHGSFIIFAMDEQETIMTVDCRITPKLVGAASDYLTEVKNAQT